MIIAWLNHRLSYALLNTVSKQFIRPTSMLWCTVNGCLTSVSYDNSVDELAFATYIDGPMISVAPLYSSGSVPCWYVADGLSGPQRWRVWDDYSPKKRLCLTWIRLFLMSMSVSNTTLIRLWCCSSCACTMAIVLCHGVRSPSLTWLSSLV